MNTNDITVLSSLQDVLIECGQLKLVGNIAAKKEAARVTQSYIIEKEKFLKHNFKMNKTINMFPDDTKYINDIVRRYDLNHINDSTITNIKDYILAGNLPYAEIIGRQSRRKLQLATLKPLSGMDLAAQFQKDATGYIGGLFKTRKKSPPPLKLKKEYVKGK